MHAEVQLELELKRNRVLTAPPCLVERFCQKEDKAPSCSKLLHAGRASTLLPCLVITSLRINCAWTLHPGLP